MKKHIEDFKEMVIKPSVSLVKWTLLLFVLFICFASFASATLLDGITAYYNLDEGNGNILTDSLNKNNASYIGTGGNWITSGFINKDFNFTNNFDTDTNKFSVSKSIFYSNATISYWARTYQASQWYMLPISEESSGKIDLRITHGIGGTGSNLYTITAQMGVTSVLTVNCQGGMLRNGTFQHIVVSRETNTTNVSNLRIYLNGVLCNTTTGNVTNYNTAVNDLNIGTKYNGDLDEIGFWNRSLTSSEITQLYNSGNGLSYPFNITDNDTITFISQSPADITTTNAITGVNITYNFSITGLNTTSPYLNWTIKNSSGSIINSYLNGTKLPDYQVTTYSNNSGLNYRFFLDDSIYPATYNINHSLMGTLTHYNYTLTTINNMLKVQFLNFTGKKYNIIEVDIATSSSTTFTDAYYCNSSYISGLPLASGNCAFIGSFNFSNTYNHCHNTSCHNFFSLSVANNSFNNITITPTSYILVSGAGAGNVYVGYVNGSARTNVSMSTTNRGLSWTNQPFTVDAHVHFYNDNDYFEYTPYASNSTNIFFNTPARTDSFNITYLQPSGVIVSLNRNDAYYTSNILVTRTNSTGFTGNISYYKYLVYDDNLSIYGVLNASTNATSLNFTPTNYSSGYYYVGVQAYDTNGYFSTSFSERINIHSEFIQPCNETVTLNSTGVPVYFNFTRNTLNETVTVYGRIGSLNYSIADETGDNIFISSVPVTTYDLYLQENIVTELNCSLSFCVNTWTRQTQPCTNNLRLINYTYNCPTPYDNPYNDTGLYEDCTSPSNTDRDLWLILILIVIWLIGLVLSLMYQPLIMVLVMVVSFALAYYTNAYFEEPIISLGIIVISAFMFFVATRMNKGRG